MRYTILGSSGFVGSHLNAYLNGKSLDCFLPGKNYGFTKAENLGHVFYCIGLTSDFRTRPMETVKAHVCKLIEVIESCSFESFTYLSSTRVYSGSQVGREEGNLSVNASDNSDLYNISKLMGEAICLSVPNDNVRIARLANVVGNNFNSGDFIFSLIKDAVDHGEIELGVSPEFAKDYISIDDVVQLLLLISSTGKNRMYNVASGKPVSNSVLVDEIKKHTACTVRFAGIHQNLTFPIISNERIKKEFSFEVQEILPTIKSLVENYKLKQNDSN